MLTLSKLSRAKYWSSKASTSRSPRTHGLTGMPLSPFHSISNSTSSLLSLTTAQASLSALLQSYLTCHLDVWQRHELAAQRRYSGKFKLGVFARRLRLCYLHVIEVDCVTATCLTSPGENAFVTDDAHAANSCQMCSHSFRIDFYWSDGRLSFWSWSFWLYFTSHH